MYEPDVDMFPLNTGEVVAMVNAGGVDRGSSHACFVHVVLGSIESAEVIDNGHHKFERVIGFEVEALEGFDGEAGGVGFAERVAPEAFDLSPDLLAECFWIITSCTLVEVALF